MLVAVVADSHFDEGSRFAECMRVHEWIADDLARRGVDLVLHSGDLYERRSTPGERAAAAAWLFRVAERAPVLITRGNHDVPGDVSLLARLRTRNPILVEESAAVHSFGHVHVAAMAWPRRAEVLARLGPTSVEEAAQAAGDALRGVLRGLGQMLDAADPEGEGARLFLGHVMVRGSSVSSGQPLVGCDFELGLEDLALVDADAYLLGHVHMPQEWAVRPDVGEDAPVIYPGSPRRTAYGEVEEKGYVLLELEPSLVGSPIVRWERVPTPCTPMVLLEGAWTEIGDGSDVGSYFAMDWPYDPRSIEGGADVRLRYEVDANRRDEARAAADVERRELLARGAIAVKVEEVVKPTSKARAPEVARARTLADKVAALWTARGFTPGAEERDRLLAKLASLEDTHAA